jgi:SAM-dependent methyltransferase
MIIFNISDYTENLIEKNSIYFAKSISKISYPPDGNADCFSIEDNSFWFKHRNNCIITLVKKYIKDKLLFDIGGGNGFVSKGLEENGIQTCLVEPGIQGCLNAKKRGLTNIICSDFDNAGLIAGTIPFIGLFDVIEHIENDDAFLSQINLKLTGGGGVVITVPAYRFLWSKEDSDAGHFRRYTLSGLSKKFNKLGFDVIYSTYIFMFLCLPILFFRTIPSLLGLAKAGTEKSRKEHTINKKGIVCRILNRLLAYEIRRIEKTKKIPFGGSCLILAKKR